MSLKHTTVTDKQIHDLLRNASSRGHRCMMEVCAAALERSPLRGSRRTDIQRQRVADAYNTGKYHDVLTKDLPEAELTRLHAAIKAPG